MLSLTTPIVTPVEAFDYISARGYAGWVAGTEAQGAAILRGQAYIAVTYNGRWVTEWTDAPEAVKFAVIEAALREARQPGSLGADYVPAERVTAETKGAGPLKKSVTYSDRPASRVKAVPVIEGLLRGLVRGMGNNFAVVRG